MAGRKRLDQIEEKIAKVERARGGDVIAAFVATLTDAQLDEAQRRLEAGENPVTVAKDLTT